MNWNPPVEQKICFDLATGLDPVESRHLDIRHGHLGTVCLRELHGMLPVGCFIDAEAVSLQEWCESFDQIGVIVHDENVNSWGN